MKEFMIKHPIISFLMVDTICTTIYNIAVGVNHKDVVRQTMNAVDRTIDSVKGNKRNEAKGGSEEKEESNYFTGVEVTGFAQ